MEIVWAKKNYVIEPVQLTRPNIKKERFADLSLGIQHPHPNSFYPRSNTGHAIAK